LQSLLHFSIPSHFFLLSPSARLSVQWPSRSSADEREGRAAQQGLDRFAQRHPLVDPAGAVQSILDHPEFGADGETRASKGCGGDRLKKRLQDMNRIRISLRHASLSPERS